MVSMVFSTRRRKLPAGLGDLETVDEHTLITEMSIRQTGKLYLPIENDICETRTYKRNVTAEGCIPKLITTNFCIGQCETIVFPSNVAGILPLFRYCGPDKTNVAEVHLKCPGRKKGYKKKKEFVIESCKCLRGKARFKT